MRTSSVVRALLRRRAADTASTSPCSSLLLHETSISTPNRISSPRKPELPPPISSLPSRSFSTSLSLKLHFSNPCLHYSRRTFNAFSFSDAAGIPQLSSKEAGFRLEEIEEKLSSAVFFFTHPWRGDRRGVNPLPILHELSKQYPRILLYIVDIPEEVNKNPYSGFQASAAETFYLYKNGKRAALVRGDDFAQLKDTMESLYSEE